MKSNRYEKFIIDKRIFQIYSADFPHDLKVEISDIEEIFLINSDEKWSEDKIKKRGQNNSFTYQRKYRSKINEEGDYLQ